MAFDSLETSQTDPRFIVWRGKQHKLLITKRNIGETPLDANQWQALEDATIGLWMRVYTLYDLALIAIANDEIPSWEMDTTAPYKKVMIGDSPMPRTISPHITVCNFDYDNITFTVVSNESAESAIVMMHSTVMSRAHMQEKMPSLFEGVTMPYRANTNSTVQRSETPTPDNVTRIGTHADSLPDTPSNVMNMPTIKGAGLRPAMLAPAGSTQGDVMYASGKGDVAWKFAFWATKKIDYNNKYAIQYGKDEIRAYPLRSVEITDFKGSVKATIKTQLGNLDIWKKKKDSDENSIDWVVFVDAMAGIGILAPQLVVGFKKSIEAIALFAISHSDDGTKEYKNLRDFRAMPQMGNTKPHEDLDTYFGEKDSIPF